MNSVVLVVGAGSVVDATGSMNSVVQHQQIEGCRGIGGGSAARACPPTSFDLSKNGYGVSGNCVTLNFCFV